MLNFVGNLPSNTQTHVVSFPVGLSATKHVQAAFARDRKGGRDFPALKKFADELGPQCSPANLDLCDDSKKARMFPSCRVVSARHAREAIYSHMWCYVLATGGRWWPSTAVFPAMGGNSSGAFTAS